MKKLFLLLTLAVGALSANAQLYLSGSSPYTQSFDGIASGLPTGWSVYTGATPTSLGSISSLNGSTSFGVYDTNRGCTSAVLGGGFKNYPSADVCSTADSCTVQQTYTDRALGVRQVGTAIPGLDSGATFLLKLANTHGMTALGANFKLQSLDTTSHRTTTWRVQYGIGTGTTPPTTFTDASTTPAVLTTGNSMFSNTPVTVSFGSALDEVNGGYVYIRIVTLDYSSGFGNRASTAIDDFNLTWTGTARMGISDVAAQVALPLNVVSATTSDITLNFDGEAGNYTASLVDMTGRTVATKAVSAVNGTQTISFNGLSVAPGIYVAKITNGAATGVTKVSVQ